MADTRDKQSRVEPYQRYHELSLALGCRAVGKKLAFQLQGRSFTLEWIPPGKSTPLQVRVSTPGGPTSHPPIPIGSPQPDAAFSPLRGNARPRVTCEAALVLRLEKAIDRFGKRILLNRELRTGDDAFDDAVYIETDAPDACVRTLLAEPAVRQFALRILQEGWQGIELSTEGEVIVTMPVKAANSLLPERFTPTLQTLAAFAEHLPALQAGRGARFGLADLVSIGAIVGSVLSWPALFVASRLWPTVDSGLVLASLSGGLIAWLVSLPVLIVIQRGRSTSLRDFCICVVFLALGLPVGSIALLLTVNGLPDAATPEVRKVEILRKYTSGSRSRTYYTTVRSWRKGESTLDIDVGSSLYHDAREGGVLVVRTKPGLLGHEWVVSLEARSGA
ncbi:MAG: hypothetical protein HY898_31705 [Deltaproteobacteria bacterium]|nr:hypothetical protein [Deltaproteobacteria bacterium]